jgi:hypothetical protein
MAFLSKADILAADDLALEKQIVPEWPKNGEPGEVYLKSLSGLEREQWEKETVLYQEYTDRTGTVKQKTVIKRDLFRAKLLALVIVDEEGNRMFTSHEDLVGLSGKSAQVLERFFNRAMEMNGLNRKEVEELEKNSETTPGANSHTSSLLPSEE